MKLLIIKFEIGDFKNYKKLKLFLKINKIHK